MIPIPTWIRKINAHVSACVCVERDKCRKILKTVNLSKGPMRVPCIILATCL